MVALATLLATLLTPAAASAHTGGPPNEQLICSPRQAWSTDGYVRGCFEVQGDDFWVYDARADGASGVVVWWTTGLNASYGECRNAHGNGTWHECTYDLHEGDRIDWEHWTFDGDTGVWTYRSGGYYTVI
jgi:hypothetical protein